MPSLRKYVDEHLEEILERLGLTPRERQIVVLAFDALAPSEIGAALSISPKTVKVHLRAVHRRLRVRDRYELVVKVSRILWRHREAPHLFLHLEGDAWLDLF